MLERLKKVYINKNKISEQFIEEEVLNVMTHLPAIFLFSFLGGYLIAKTDYVISNLIYIFTVINLFSFSTLYHSIQKLKPKKMFQLYDHISIYLLIGGSYTPILVYLKESISLTYIWVLIAVGILERIFIINGMKKIDGLFLTKCILAGIFIASIKSFWFNMPSLSFWLVLSGGFFYITGSYYFMSKIKYAHSKWHIAVLLGSICHFMAIYFLTK